jgi:phosphoglycerol transferase MdoB-like AlkP superfamily enzyme
MTPRERALPWSGFVLGAIGWAVSQQWGSARVNDGCLTAWNWQTFLIGIAGLVLVLVGAAISWRLRRDNAPPAARFVAAVSLAADAVFALAILFHTISTLIIPRCFS